LANPPTRSAEGTRLRGSEKAIAKRRAITTRAVADLDHWVVDHLHVAAAA
jgi:methylenetetrahydrofolate--tRNA-(uracil-5-)-methyltransferase